MIRTKALLSGIKAKLGPVALETDEHLSGFKLLLEEGPCSTYNKLRMNYVFGSGQLIKAVLSPFISNAFDSQNLINGFSHERDAYYT